MYVWGGGENWAKVKEGMAQDPMSQRKYGLIEDGFQMPDVTTVQGLTNIARSHVKRRFAPRLLLTCDITEPPFPNPGDRVPVSIHSVTIEGKKLSYTAGIMRTESYTPENGGSMSASILLDGYEDEE